MKKMMVLGLLFLAAAATAQEALPGFEVTLNTRIHPRQVPLNRSCELIIEVSWQGDLDRIDIGSLEEPLLTNFDVTGKSSSNRLTETEAGRLSVKTIFITLMPRTLGMAYIESAALTYTDGKTDKVHSLRTDRIAVEVTDPVPEKESSSQWWILPGLAAFFVAAILFFWFKKPRRKSQDFKEPRFLEEIFLDELKQNVDLKASDRVESFARLAKLFRLYLSKKYRISTLDVTTEALIPLLKEKGIDEEIVSRCERVFTRADVVKFSGQQATQAELEEAYTTVETLFESILSQAHEETRHREDKGRKKRRPDQSVETR